jgi:hypothetical protein
MRSSKIQDKGDFGRRKMSFKNGLREKTRTRQIASNKGAKVRMSGALRHAPSSQLRFVFVYMHAQPACAGKPFD